MKTILCFLLILCNIIFISAQTFDVVNIKDSGDKAKRINLVFMGDGYTASELDKFIIDATNFSNSIFTQSPFQEYAEYFNVFAIKVPSNESGTNHPGTSTEPLESTINPVVPISSVDTYFNTSFDTANIHRLLYTFDSSTIYNVLANNLPEYDQPIILVNSEIYGGAGGPYATTSTGPSGSEIVIHEIGHSLFDLKDEYYPGDGLAGEAINMTQETDPTIVNWKNWVGSNGINIYQHTDSDNNAKPWYRPHQRCKMRYLGDPFCAVCKEGIVEKIHSLISPINNFTPNNNSVDNPTFPIDFQLDLMHPTNKNLESVWTLNGANFENNVDNISISETDLIEGTNTLTTIIHDNTSFLLVDNHDSFHINTVTWTINYTTLAIDDIKSEVYNYNITLYPNPTNSIVNFEFESDRISDLKVEIMSIDGKIIKSTTLSNLENKQIDISDLSQGIYLTNFYSENILIASKRLVKN